MNTFKKILSYDTNNKSEVIPITEDIKKVIEESGFKNGTLFGYSLHTTLSLFIQEAIEPNLCKDIINQLTKIVDNDGSKYEHSCAKHPSNICRVDNSNGPSHVRQTLTNQNIILDISGGKLNIGQWQDIALLELDGPRKNRKVFIKIVEN